MNFPPTNCKNVVHFETQKLFVSLLFQSHKQNKLLFFHLTQVFFLELISFFKHWILFEMRFLKVLKVDKFCILLPNRLPRFQHINSLICNLRWKNFWLLLPTSELWSKEEISNCSQSLWWSPCASTHKHSYHFCVLNTFFPDNLLHLNHSLFFSTACNKSLQTYSQYE
jgi:hypothetical protein